jgi:hypothetical protein
MIRFKIVLVPDGAFDREFNAIDAQAVTSSDHGLISGPTSHSLLGP